MANDYSLDPFQIEETELDEKRKAAMAQLLRIGSSQSPLNNPAMAFQNAYHGATARDDLEAIGPQKRDLARRANIAFEKSIEGVRPEVANLLRNPALRATGEAQLGKDLDQKRWNDEDERDAAMDMFRRGGESSEGGGSADYVNALRLATSNDPRRAKRGEVLLKQLAPFDSSHNVRGTLSGGSREDPGATGAYRQREQARGDNTLVDVKLPNGQIQQMLRGDAYAEGYLKRPAPSGDSTYPATTPYPTVAGPVSGPIPSGSGRSSPLAGAVAAESGGNGRDPLTRIIPQLEGWDPNNPVSPKGAVGPFQIMPENVAKLSRLAGRPLDPMNPDDAELMATHILSDGRRKYGNNDMAVLAHYNGGYAQGDAVAQGKPPPAQETQGYLQRAAQLLNPVGTAQAQPAPQSALPGAVAASGAPPLQRPSTGVPGRSDPVAQDIYKDQRKGRENTYQKDQTSGGVGDTHDILNKMEALHKTWTGFTEVPMFFENALSTATGSKTRRGQATEQFARLTGDMVASVLALKQYGTGNSISDADLLAVKERVISAKQDPSSRMALIQDMREFLNSAEWRDNRIREKVEAEGKPLIQAKNESYHEYQAYKKQRDKAQQNPIAAGSATQSALPASVDAAGGVPPGPMSPEERGGQNQGFEGGDTGVMDFLGSGQSYKDMASALPITVARVITNPFTKSGREGTIDAYKNIWEGAKGLVGQSDREQAMADVAAQEKRADTDPRYAAARTVSTYANPLTVAGGAATTIPRAVLAGGTLAALQPAPTATDQAMNAGIGATIGGVSQVGSRFFPSTKPSGAIRAAGLDDAKAAGPVTLTSPQLNPTLTGSKIANVLGVNEAAGLNQSTQLTRFLMKEAQIPGDRLTRPGMTAAYEAAESSGRASIAGKAPLPIPEAKALVDAITDLAETNGKFVTNSELNKFWRAASVQSKAKGGGRAMRSSMTEYDGDQLYSMWKEIDDLKKSKPAQAQAKVAIESLIEASRGPEALAAFKAAQQRGRHVSNIDRVWSSGGGSGTDVGTGILTPSHLKLEAGRGPRDAITDSVTELVDLLNMRNYKPGVASQSSGEPAGIFKSFVQDTVGKALYQADRIGQKIAGPGAPEWRKKLSDALRMGTAVTPQTVYQGRGWEE